MRKDSLLNLVILFISIAGAVVAYLLGERLLIFVAYLPYSLQCGIYLLFVALVCCLVIMISEEIRSGRYIQRNRDDFKYNVGKAMAIFLPAAFVLGIITQLLYAAVGVSSVKPDFQGTMIVSDISGSMLDSDPDGAAVEGILAYIDTVPAGEYIGVIVFTENVHMIRPYAPLEDENDRDRLKQLVRGKVAYDFYGGTDIQAALTEAMNEIRKVENPKWPGLVLLFSDGGSEINYSQLQRVSLGDAGNYKNRVPVNTIYYASSPLSGSQMSLIAQKTGGVYCYMGFGDDEMKLQDAFTHSRSIYEVERPHLLQSYFGDARDFALRVVLQVLFLALWGVLIGGMIVIFLNNNRLIGDYLILKIIVSFVFAIVFGVLMLTSDIDAGALGRALLVVGMCIMYLPIYRWD